MPKRRKAGNRRRYRRGKGYGRPPKATNPPLFFSDRIELNIENEGDEELALVEGETQELLDTEIAPLADAQAVQVSPTKEALHLVKGDILQPDKSLKEGSSLEVIDDRGGSFRNAVSGSEEVPVDEDIVPAADIPIDINIAREETAPLAGDQSEHVFPDQEAFNSVNEPILQLDNSLRQEASIDVSDDGADLLVPNAVSRTDEEVLLLEVPADEDIVSFDLNVSFLSGIDLDASTEPLSSTLQNLDLSGNTSLQSGIYKIANDSTFSVAAMDLLLSPEKSEAKVKPTRLEIVENIVNSEHQEADSSAQDFLMRVKVLVTSLLSKGWLCVIGQDNIKVLKFPPPEVIVQREISVSSKGQICLKVHGKVIPPEHEIWTSFPEYDSVSCESAEGFGKFVVGIYGIVRSYEMCRGICEETLTQFSKRLKGRMVFDENSFKEPRYTTTWRDRKCSTLVRARCKYCGPCTVLKKVLIKKLKRLPKNTPNKNTNNRYLNTAQKEKKLFREAIDIRNLKRSKSYYVQKVHSLLNNVNKTVELDDVLDADFQTIIGRQKDNLNDLQKIFFEEQLKFARLPDKRGMRWHPMMIRLALRIQQLTSSKVLDALNDDGIISLPSSRTLFNYSHYHSIKPGLNIPVINKLHEEMQEYSEAKENLYQRFHVLMMDEMSISENLVQSRSTGELIGFIDLPEIGENIRDLKTAISSIDVGLEDESTPDNSSTTKKKSKPKTTSTKGTDMKPALATKMLTYMVKGVASDQKRIVAAYGVDVLDVNDLFRKTWSVIGELEMADVNIIAIVCDGLSVNRRFIKMHKPFSGETDSGTIFDTTNPCGGGRPLFFISDVPHLLKTIRNAFNSSGEPKAYSKLLCINGEFIVWQTIVDLYEAEKYNHLRLAYKLNKQVVHLNNFSRMRVGYAAAVMSKTVANALRQMKRSDIGETINFIEKVNDFFDCLNGAHSSEAKRKRNSLLQSYKLENKEERFQVLRDFLQYLKEWKKQCDEMEGLEASDRNKAFLPIETFTGIDMTIHAFIGAINYLLGPEVKAKFLNARVFNQDMLEQFFSTARCQGGSSNPNAAQFLLSMRRHEMTRQLGFRTRGNTKCYKEEKNITELCNPLPRLKVSRPKKQARRSLDLENVEPCIPSTFEGVSVLSNGCKMLVTSETEGGTGSEANHTLQQEICTFNELL